MTAVHPEHLARQESHLGWRMLECHVLDRRDDQLKFP
jgi:hypothetical protein